MLVSELKWEPSSPLGHHKVAVVNNQTVVIEFNDGDIYFYPPNRADGFKVADWFELQCHLLSITPEDKHE